MSWHWMAIILISGLAAGCASTGVRRQSDTMAQGDLLSYQTVLLTVHGLSCPLCSNNLDGQLRRIDGVQEARIDLKTGAVSVRLREGHTVSRRDLARAVEDAGFTLKKIEPGDAGE